MEFAVVGLGIGLAFLVVPVRNIIVSILDERRAVRQFRACYRSAKLTIVKLSVNGERGLWTERDVIYLALETMRFREDVKCGRHRFGESFDALQRRTMYTSPFVGATAMRVR